jgi:hypothetical protein
MRQNFAQDNFDENAIREIAYALWERRGAPIGSPDVDWIEAERQLSEARLDLREDGQQPETNVKEVGASRTRLKTKDSEDRTHAGSLL